MSLWRYPDGWEVYASVAEVGVSERPELVPLYNVAAMIQAMVEDAKFMKF